MSDKLVKNLNFGSDAKSKILKGIDKLTNAVSSTLGASGKCVILEDQHGQPSITKDGVTVAEAITLLDPVENIGATLLKDAARKTVKEAGDGTTTATVLANEILTLACVVDKNNTRSIKEGINSGVKKVITYLEKISIPVKDEMVKQVATISANNDIELGEKIGDAFLSVGKTGVVSMEESNTPDTHIEIVDGIQYNKGLKSVHFVTDEAGKTAELKKPLVLIVESKIENIRKIQAVLEYVIKNNRSLFIIADVEPQVLSALAMNKIKGNIKINIVDAPVFGYTKKQVLNDIALMTGATVINEHLGDDLDLIQPEHLGECVKVSTTEYETIIQTKPPSKEVKKLITKVKKDLDKEKAPGHITRLEKRLALLSAKIAGGIALLNAAANIDEENIGEEILTKSIIAPFRTILTNAGLEPVISKEDGFGIDVVTGNMVNMIDEGIIDPLSVTKSALKNAASVATTILSTDCVINNIRVHEGDRR